MEDRLPRKLAAILYADVAGYSRLMGEDEDATHRTLSEFLDLISATVETHGGQVMHYAGDAVLAKFDAVVDALSSAVAIQNKIYTRNAQVLEQRKVQFRIGVNLGDVIEDRGDIYGDGVNIAARLESLADVGGICVSDSVRTAAGKQPGFVYADLGEQEVKNISEPVRAYKLVIATGNEPEAVKTALELPDKPSIAVLPFTNMSDDPEQEYFADGIVDDLITALSNVQSFFVIARNSTFVYKGAAVNVTQVGRELGVQYVMEGSVRMGGNRVRVNAQFLDARTGKHIWADRYDRRVEDIFDVQDEITAMVVGAIEPHLNRAEAERIKQKRPEKLDAYDFTLRGLAAMNKLSPEGNTEALELFLNAIDVDPSYARASVCASWCYRRHVQLRGLTLSTEDRDESIRLAHRALTLDPADPYVLWQAGLTFGLLKNDFDSMAELVDRSLAINANSVRAWLASGSLRCILGETERAIEDAERAMRLSPLDPSVWVADGLLASALMQNKSYEESTNRARKSVRAHRFNLPAYYVMAASCAQIGRLDVAHDTVDQLLKLDPKATITRLTEIYPVRRYKNYDGFIDGLRKAGLPD